PAPACSTPFPYTTLFRSDDGAPRGPQLVVPALARPVHAPAARRARYAPRRRAGRADGRARRCRLSLITHERVDGVEVLSLLGLRSEEHTSERQSACNLVC